VEDDLDCHKELTCIEDLVEPRILILITVVLYSAPSRLPTQKRSQPRSNITVLRAERKEME